MSRASVSDVQEILDTDLTSVQITACLTIANLMTTNICAASTNPALGADELKEIERWLAAHFAAIRDPVALRAKIGDSEQWSFPASVTTAWGTGLRLTPYGQQAIAADRSGLLGRAGLMKGSFRAGPREDSKHFTRGITKSTS